MELLDTLTLASTDASEDVNVFAKVNDNTAYYCRGDEDGQAGLITISDNSLTKTVINSSGSRFYDFCYLSPGKPAGGSKELVGVEYDPNPATPINQLYLRRISIDPDAGTITEGPRTASLFDGLPSEVPTDYSTNPVAFTALNENSGYALVKILDGSTNKFYQIPWTVSGLTVSLGSASLVHQISEPFPATYYEPINAFGVGGGHAIQFWLYVDTVPSPDSMQLYWGVATNASIGSYSNTAGTAFNSIFQPWQHNRPVSVWNGAILRPSKVLTTSISSGTLTTKNDTLLSTSSALSSATVLLDKSATLPFSGAVGLHIANHKMGGRKFVMACYSGAALYISEATLSTDGTSLSYGDSLQIDSNIDLNYAVFHFNSGSQAMVLGQDNDVGNNIKVWLIGGLSGLSGASGLYTGQGSLTKRFDLPFDRVSPYGMSLNETQGRLAIGGLLPVAPPVIYADYPYAAYSEADDNLDTPEYPISSVKWL